MTIILNEKKRHIIELAKLVAPRDPVAAAARLADFLPLNEVPASFWTEAGIRGVARKLRTIPSFAQLVDAAEEWDREQSGALGISHVGWTPPGADPELETGLAYFRRRETEGFAGAPIQAANVGGGRAHVLSLMRKIYPAAWAQITGRPNPEMRRNLDDGDRADI